MVFPILCGLALILAIIMFSKKPKKERPKPEVIDKDKQPVIIELIPKGTSNNPVRCIVNDTVYFKVLGYSDYKKEIPVELNGSNIRWFTWLYPNSGWEKDFGIENTYIIPSKKGYYEVYVKYIDNKLNTSSKVKILVEA